MATATAYTPFNADTFSIWFGTVTFATPTYIQVAYGAQLQEYFGADFQRDLYGNITGGMLTQTKYWLNGVLQYDVTGLSHSMPTVYGLLQANDPQGLLALLFNGDDTFNGSSGNDVANGYAGDDSMLGGGGNDAARGQEGNDTLDGGDGNDTLDGGTGADTLSGGRGTDTYIVDDPGDVVSEAPAELFPDGDTVLASLTYTLPTTMENLTLTGSVSINGTGNAFGNVVTGNSGNNVLSGGLGNDTLIGNPGDDTLDGGLGNDSLTGGAGDDTYVVDAASDVVTENPGEGVDLVRSSVTYTLTASVENLALVGTGVIDGLGNDLGNAITGNDSHNLLSGAAGNDALIGGLGNDTVFGGAGNDTVTGGAGNDTLDGGGGADTAVFSGPRANYMASGQGSGIQIVDLTGADGTDFVTGIERFQLSDMNLAIDLGPGEAAGNTVRIIGAAFDAPTIQQHPDYVGIGLSLFDSGMSMLAVCELVAPLLGLDNTGFVNTVYQNVVGAPPSAGERDLYVGLLQGSGGTMTQADLLMLAANVDANAVNINLVGLQQSGVEFV